MVLLLEKKNPVSSEARQSYPAREAFRKLFFCVSLPLLMLKMRPALKVFSVLWLISVQQECSALIHLMCVFFIKKIPNISGSLIFLLPASLSTMGSNCLSVNQRLNYSRSFEKKERKEEAKIETQTLKSSSESGNLQQ